MILAELRERCLRGSREEGLCISCSEVAESGRKLCARHLEYHRLFKREQRRNRRAAGQCLQCGEATGGHSLCPRHLLANNSRLSAWRQRRRLQRLRRTRCPRPMVGPGHCDACGTPNSRGTWLCTDCRDDKTASHAELRAERRAAGLCLCGREPRRGKGSCVRCARRWRKRSKRVRAARRAAKLCRYERCQNPLVGRSFCAEHRKTETAARTRWARRRSKVTATEKERTR